MSCQKNGFDDGDSEHLRNELGNRFHLIQFVAMEGKIANEILSNELYDSLFSREELTDILQKKFDSNFHSKIFESVPRSKALTEKLLCARESKRCRLYATQRILRSPQMNQSF